MMKNQPHDASALRAPILDQHGRELTVEELADAMRAAMRANGHAVPSVSVDVMILELEI